MEARTSREGGGRGGGGARIEDWEEKKIVEERRGMSGTGRGREWTVQ